MPAGVAQAPNLTGTGMEGRQEKEQSKLTVTGPRAGERRQRTAAAARRLTPRPRACHRGASLVSLCKLLPDKSG